MTDRIDLDELDTADERTEEDTANRGDWFWRGEGRPGDEPGRSTGESDRASAGETDVGPPGADDDRGTADEDVGEAADRDAGEDPVRGRATPRVPRENDDAPVGIPVDGGGAGGTAAADRDAGGSNEAATPTGPHGDGPAEMTLAFTYRAVQRLENLHAALADADGWTDFVGIVGDVDAHVLQKFQRDERIDVDFFNGSGTGPAERLTDVDEHSMFYAERMTVVGLEDEEWMADESGWEFVPLAEAAGEAGWDVA